MKKVNPLLTIFAIIALVGCTGSEKGTLETEVEDLRQEVERLQEENKTLQDEKEAERKEVDEISIQAESLQAEKQSLETEKQNLAASASTDRNQLQQQVQQLQAENQTLKKDKEAANTRADNLQNQKNNLQSQVNNLQAELNKKPKTVTIKPYGSLVGGPGGNSFTDIPAGDSTVKKVRIRSGWWIDGIQIVHQLSSGAEKAFPHHGGNGGGPSEFVLQSGEYITGISGKRGQFVGQIKIHTNKRTSPAYGLAKGNGSGSDFTIKAPSGYEVVGFQGRSGAYLDAVGIVIKSR